LDYLRSHQKTSADSNPQDPVVKQPAETARRKKGLMKRLFKVFPDLDDKTLRK
jgi:hypothetical protein